MLTLKVLFSDWLCSPSVCAAKIAMVYPLFQSTTGNSRPEGFFPAHGGEMHLSLLQIAELGEGARKPTLFSGCLHYRVDVLAVDHLFSLVVQPLRPLGLLSSVENCMLLSPKVTSVFTKDLS